MNKYEYNDLTETFDIDPMHLSEGLAQAEKDGRTAIAIQALDQRSGKLSFDAAVVAQHPRIKRLFLHEDLTPDGQDISGLTAIKGLEQLTTVEWSRLDYAAFGHLKELVLGRGTTLAGLEKVKSLEFLYLRDWASESLPAETSKLAASSLRIDASRKLKDISAIFKMQRLKTLTLAYLPKLEIPQKTLHLDELEFLHVEKSAWTDFSQLHSKSLRELELFGKFDSLAFIAQLPKLEKLYIWECIDGDMTPVLRHPTLKHIYFDKNRKHYSHKEADLQTQLSTR
jgi:hypothetical protein